ncbi:hypothetical protein [Actinomadura algeriensis]|uniref:Uncharacterized protein n=1 Tax=Actinomadura algeriensis TaxID=1679523 RepID=A0ABR9JYY7_9ACTN|nr:hypothetical protein [Actinomadura algeriensis]MBE1535778.1 hypothetical protein [Actinomadura algeriensis]
MKSGRPARRGRSIWGRIAGYGGAVLLVAAAAAVLLVPLLDKDGGAGAAGARTPANGVTTPSNAPTRHTAPPTVVQTPGAAGQGTGGTSQGGGQGGASGGSSGDGGPLMPGERGGGTGPSWCPQGTAAYRAAGTGVDVVVAVASSGAVRAELQVQGGSPQSQQTTVRGGSPHTFRFTGVSVQRVERVKITTVSVGVAMQTCYARAAA